MKILIDNGHGKETPGKCSPDAAKGLTGSPFYFKEYAWCREVAELVKNIFVAEGFDAELLVPEITDVPLKERVRRINAACKKHGKENVLLVSVHVNAAGKGDRWYDARGWSIFTTKGVTESDRLAEHIYKVAKKRFKAPLSVRTYDNKEFGHDFESNLYLLLNSYCTAVLVENFFQDNKEDVLYLKSNLAKINCAEVIVDGVENYLRDKE